MLLFGSIFLVSVYKKTWKGIPTYYKSLSYVSFINAMYYYLFKRHLIWEFNPGGMDWRVVRLVHIFLITPLLVLLFLSNFPKEFKKQVKYVSKWVFASTIVDWLLLKSNMLIFKNGWNTLWSGLIYLQMYLFSYLFLKRPFLVSGLSVISVVFYMGSFRLPLSKRLYKGPILLLFKKTKLHWVDRLKKGVCDCFAHLIA